jgi:hypothetical protein
MAGELQKRKKLLSSTFSRAVVVTVLIHLVCLGLFKVKMLQLPKESSPITIQVETSTSDFFKTEISSSNEIAEASSPLEGKQNLQKPLKTAFPFWNQAHLNPLTRDEDPTLKADKRSQPWAFEQIEKSSFKLKDSMNLSYGTSYHPIKIQLFGDLTKTTPAFIPFQEEVFYYPKHSQTIPFLFTFNVKIENKTGQIFWIAPSKETQGLESVKKLENIAQKIAKDVHFKKAIKNPGITLGTIEVLFEIEEGKTLPKSLIVSK